MDYNSNKSKGYVPLSSGPNMTGYYMGESPNLMNMMQTGGQTTAGGAALARALQMQKDQRRLESAQRKEAKRQKKGGLFGSIGGIAGGLLGAALAPVTGGASLVLASGLGTALGRRAGEGLGAGKSRGVDRSGTVFGQQSFRDVEQASRDYTRGMGERALVSGLTAAATAGFSPGGGIYGATGRAAEAGKLGTIGTRLREGASAIGKAGAKLGLGSGKALTTASGELLSSGLPANIAGSALADTVLKGLDSPGGNTFGISQMPSLNEAEILGDVAVPDFDVSLPDFSNLPQAPSVSEKAYLRSLPDAISLGEENALLDAARTAQGAQATAKEASRSAGSLMGYLQRQELGPLADFSLRRGSSSSMDPSLVEAVSPYFNLPMSPYGSPSMAYVGVGPLTVLGGSPSYGMENGGLIGMQTGGLTAEQILEQQGLQATPEQLALFQRFDPTGISRATEGAGQSLLNMTAGQGLASAGGGFGAQQSAISQIVEQGQKSLEREIEDEQKSYQSQVMGTAADIVAGGGEFREYLHTNAPQNPNVGDTYARGGKEYEWNGSQWVDLRQAGGPRDDYDYDDDYYTSDVNLKENIDLVGLSDSGINIYTFEYKDKKYGEGVYRGVMAQEVPWASFEANNGYLVVDYSKVDVDFEQVYNG